MLKVLVNDLMLLLSMDLVHLKKKNMQSDHTNILCHK